MSKKKLSKRVATIVVVMFAVIVTACVTFVTAQKAKVEMSSLLGRNLVALAESEDEESKVKTVQTETEERTVTIVYEGEIEYKCQALVRVTKDCRGTGNLRCKIGDYIIEGEPWDCRRIIETK